MGTSGESADRRMMMEYRVGALQQAVAGFLQTGVLLVAKTTGGLIPAGLTDDLGLYAVVPLIAAAFGLTATQATTAFLLGSIAVASVVAFWAIVRATDDLRVRLYGTLLVVALALLALQTWDVYVYLIAVPLLCMPWLLTLSRSEGISRIMMWTLPLAGFIIGFGHMVRSHSGTPVVLAILALVALDSKAGVGRKLVALGGLAVGIALVIGLFSGLVAARDTYLTREVPRYEIEASGHPFWHSVYIGLGYVPNEMVPEYRDEVAVAKVNEIAPGTPYLSPKYEAILKAEVFRIARQEPGFVIRQVLAKIPPTVKWPLIFGNIGLLLFFWSRPPVRLWAGFTAGLAFESLFGVLVIPSAAYLVGLASFSAVVAIIGATRYTEQPRSRPRT